MKQRIILELNFFLIFFLLVFIETYLLKLKFNVVLAGIDGGLTGLVNTIIKMKVTKISGRNLK